MDHTRLALAHVHVDSSLSNLVPQVPQLHSQPDSASCVSPDRAYSSRDEEESDHDSDSEDSDYAKDRIPPWPYEVGFEFTAIRHEIPIQSAVAKSSTGYQGTLSQFEHCLADPVDDGYSNHDFQKALSTTACIRTGRKKGAQIATVNNNLVAKIYDPLYYYEHDHG